MLQLLLAFAGYYRDQIPYVFLVAFVIFYIYQVRLHKAHISSKEFALKKTQKGLKDLIVKKRYNERKYQKAVEEKKMDIHFLKLRIKKYEQEIKIFQYQEPNFSNSPCLEHKKTKASKSPLSMFQKLVNQICRLNPLIKFDEKRNRKGKQQDALFMFMGMMKISIELIPIAGRDVTSQLATES
ncbi:hypothetical protein GQX74_005001 [Glossina fuscipes]|nr:hypothetical protein GQX74_005001 [Glossina fuscipes]